MTFLELQNLFSVPVEFNENIALMSDNLEHTNQKQTNESFSEKWVKLDKESETIEMEIFQKNWVLELYGFETISGFKDFLKNKQVIIDAGWGLGYKSAWMAELAPHAAVFGIDFSDAAYVAADRYKAVKNLFFFKGDIANLHFKKETLDFLCDQAIHQIEDPKQRFAHLSSLSTPIGKFACYVYAKKALPLELVDDYLRKATHNLSHQEMCQFSDQLTELGKRLTELNIKFNCPNILLLGIEGGEYDIQGFTYWDLIKCFYYPKLIKQENDAFNFDWYSPSNAKRYSPEAYKQWAYDLNLKIDFFRSEEAAYTARVCN